MANPADLDPSNPELEARIAANPADDAAWHVYADWLNERHSPRGELAALQLAYAKKRLPSTRKKIEALVEKHAALFWGEWLARYREDYASNVKWKGGFWQKGWIKADDDASIETALGCRSLKLMESLSTAIGQDDMSSIVRCLAKYGPFPALRRLRIGDELEYGQSDVGSELERRTLKGLAALPAALPRLRSLFLCIFEHLDFATFPDLRRLRIAGAPFTAESLRAVITTPQPKLTSLELTIASGMDAEGSSTPQNLVPADFEPLVGAKQLPKLKKLSLHIAFADDGNARLIEDLQKMFAGARFAVEIDDSQPF